MKTAKELKAVVFVPLTEQEVALIHHMAKSNSSWNMQMEDDISRSTVFYSMYHKVSAIYWDPPPPKNAGTR